MLINGAKQALKYYLPHYSRKRKMISLVMIEREVMMRRERDTYPIPVGYLVTVNHVTRAKHHHGTTEQTTVLIITTNNNVSHTYSS